MEDTNGKSSSDMQILLRWREVWEVTEELKRLRHHLDGKEVVIVKGKKVFENFRYFFFVFRNRNFENFKLKY